MAKKRERELTAQEEKRKERFEEIARGLEADGWDRHDLILDLSRANVVLTLVSIPAVILSGLLFFSVLGSDVLPDRVPLLPFILELLVLTVVHELIHGVTWSRFCSNGWRDIEFGMIWKTLNPYCTCATPLPRGQYIAGALMPLIVLGVIPFTAGLILHDLSVYAVGLVMILGAGGDIMMVIKLLRFRPQGDEELVYDHPYEGGCVVFVRQKGTETDMERKYDRTGETVRAPETEKYPGIHTQDDLYDALTHVWCAETCAPRMRGDWTRENMTLGQCSVTSFLAQDIFGGEVLGYLLPDGNYHCFNKVGDSTFDLTSAQFPDGVPHLAEPVPQSRETHFAKEEKRLRYELLRERLSAYCHKELSE